MLIKYSIVLSAVAVGLSFTAAPASALTMAECSAKYNAAKDSNSLAGKSWAQFRKAECSTGAVATEEPANSGKKSKKTVAAEEDEAKGLTSKQCSAKFQAAKAADALDGMKWNDFRKAECGPGATAEFVAAKPENKTAKAEATSDDGEVKGLTSKQCSAKFQAAKAADALDGMKWNDFRKAECGPGAAAEFVGAKPDKKSAKAEAALDDGEAKGLTSKQCSAKFQAAKAANALDGMKWNDFRKAECGPGATAEFVAAKPEKKKADANAEGQGLSMSECSAKYKTAKADGSLNGLKWNDFRKSECGASASDDDTVPAMDEANYTDEPETPVAQAPRGVKFPRGVSAKFSEETPAKARMHTCLEQYYANKDAETLGGLRWIQKGGGYYSLCNARLKNES